MPAAKLLDLNPQSTGFLGGGSLSDGCDLDHVLAGLVLMSVVNPATAIGILGFLCCARNDGGAKDENWVLGKGKRGDSRYGEKQTPSPQPVPSNPTGSFITPLYITPIHALLAVLDGIVLGGERTRKKENNRGNFLPQTPFLLSSLRVRIEDISPTPGSEGVTHASSTPNVFST